MKDKIHIKHFNEHQKNLNISESNSTDLESIENKIIKCLDEADEKLDANDFNRLSESIIDYIDEIIRSKK